MDWAFPISTHLLLWTLGSGLLTLVVVVLLGWWLRRHRDPEAAAAAGKPPEEAAHPTQALAAPAPGEAPSFTSSSLPGELTLSFLRATQYLRRQSTGRQRLYRVPWFLLLGEAGAGKSAILQSLGAAGVGTGASDGGRHGLGWSFFDRGVVLDVPGEYLLQPATLNAHERSWRGLLRLLNRSRRRRPLDGVVLVLPVGDFLPSSELTLAELARKARFLAGKLTQLQQETAVCFPVYVLISQCDQIPGFASFCQALPPARRREIFGWSSPYRADAGFDAAWVDEAFEEILQSLHRTQSELFVERLEAADPAELFFFPGKMLEMQERLRTFLQHIFRGTAYREGYPCRGIYFSGDGPEAAEAALPRSSQALARPLRPSLLALPLQPERRNPRPVFLEELFERKIFPEWGLAYPERRAFSFRRGALVTTQSAALAATLVLGLGMAVGYYHLNRLQQQAVPVLRSVRDEAATPSEQGAAELQYSAHNLVNSIAALGNDRFVSLFYPASWSRSLDHQMEGAVELALKNSVMLHLRQELMDHALSLSAAPVVVTTDAGVAHNADADATDPTDPLDAALPPAADFGRGSGAAAAAPHPPAKAPSALSPNLAMDQLDEYAALQQYTAQIETLEDNIARYQRLVAPGTPDPVADLNGLMHYFHAGDADTIQANDESYLGEALTAASGQPLSASDMTTIRNNVEAGMEARVDALYAAWFERSPSLAQLQRLEGQIEALQSPDFDYPQLQSLQTALEQAETWTNDPESNRMADPAALFDGALRKVTLDPVEHSAELPYGLFYPTGDLENYIRHGANEDWQQLHAAFQGLSTPLTGPVLEFAPHSAQLSAGVEGLRLPIVNLMSLSFMAGLSGNGTDDFRSEIPVGSQLSWDTQPLRDASAMVGDYQRYLQEGLQQAPAAVRDAFRQIALTHLVDNLDVQLGLAQSWAPAATGSDESEESDAAARNFAAAQPLLDALLLDYSQLGQDEAHARLQHLLNQQALGLLTGLDRALGTEAPYSTARGMANWQGQRTATLGAFDLHTPDELGAYLAAQRQRVESLAAAAAPLVAFLQPMQAARPSPLISRWQGLVAAVQQYQDKRPGNSLSQLEGYITDDLDKMAAGSHCPPPAGEDIAAAAGGDYFQQAQAQLEQTVAGRCRALDANAAGDNYSAVAELFNRTLAHKFPFADSAAAGADEAEPADITAVYTELERAQSSFGAQLASLPATPAAFVRELGALRPLWSALLSQAAPVPIFDVTPTFRVNRDREQGGNEIIGWKLTIGAQTFPPTTAATTAAAAAAARWVPGQPIVLTLQWASDSPLAPVGSPTASGNGPVVRNRTVTFTYSDPWSLFALIAGQRAPSADFDLLRDPAPTTLAFSIPTAPAAPGMAVARGAKATSATLVFIRLAIQSPGTVESLRIPEFPPQAPRWEAATDAGNHSH